MSIKRRQWTRERRKSTEEPRDTSIPAEGVFFASPPRWFVVLSLIVFVLAVTGHAMANALDPVWRWSMGDLQVYRDAGALVLHSDQLYHTAFTETHLLFLYPPWAALCFVPVASLPYGALMLLATTASIAALCASVWLAWGMLGRPRDRMRLAVTALICAVFLWTEPIQATLGYGQINLLVMVLVVADLAQPDTSRSKGIGIGIATGLKLTPAIFIVYLLLTRRIRAAATALATFVGTVLVGFVFLPQESKEYWGGIFIDSRRVMTGIAYIANQSLHGALARLVDLTGHPEAAEGLGYVLALGVGVLGLTVAAIVSRRGQELLGVTVCAVTGLLVSPVSWSNHWVWIAPFAVLLVYSCRRIRLQVLGVAVVYALFLPWSIGGIPDLIRNASSVEYRNELDFMEKGLYVILGNLYTILGILFLIFVARRVVRARWAYADHVELWKAKASLSSMPSKTSDPQRRRTYLKAVARPR
jgi:alpha-1,2-mannosyltransferase